MRRRGERGLRDRRRGEAPTVVAGFHDVAMVSQAVEERGASSWRRRTRAGPFTEGKIGGDDDGRGLVEPADEMEQQLAAGLGERQVAEFVENDEVHPGQMLGDTTLPSIAGILDLQAVDEVDHVVEPAAGTRSDAASGDCDGHMGFAGAGTADQDSVTLLGDEAAAGEIVDQRLVDGCLRTGSPQDPWRAAVWRW